MKRTLFVTGIMSLIVSLVLAIIMVLVFVGYNEYYFGNMLKSFVLGTAVSFPLSLILPGILNKLADRLNIK